ncbi:MAG: hypothetical protein IJA43_08075 [Clostridia bacterium]|nr:hypothetical protein [Clostridia bacterium]
MDKKTFNKETNEILSNPSASENKLERLETQYLSSNEQVKKEILEGAITPIEECVPENEVNW